MDLSQLTIILEKITDKIKIQKELKIESKIVQYDSIKKKSVKSSYSQTNWVINKEAAPSKPSIPVIKPQITVIIKPRFNNETHKSRYPLKHPNIKVYNAAVPIK